MPYIHPLARDAVDASTGATLDVLQSKLGVLPNLFRTLAHAPAALNAYVQLAGAAAGGRLDARQRELIALTVGEANDCTYCVAAHGAIGRMVGLDAAAIDAAREARAGSAKDAAALRLARAIVEHRGRVPAAELDAFRAAGHGDGDILEVLVNVVLNIYTNYTNHIAGTEIDFPLPAVRRAA